MAEPNPSPLPHKPQCGDQDDFEHPINIEQYRKLGYQMVDTICEYFQGIEELPVRPDVEPGFMTGMFAPTAPEEPEPWDDIMDDLKSKIIPGMTHWQHPRFFSFYPSNHSFPAMLADMMVGAMNTIGFSWAASPAMTELEMVMMDWLAQLCGLPEHFLCSSGKGGGAIQGTSSEAVLVALLSARARMMEGRPAEDHTKLVAYANNQVHSCFPKACMVAGISNCRLLPASADHEWALQPEVLEAAIKEDLAAGLLPFYLCATVGTTSSAAVDPIAKLVEVAKRYGVWVNVDAAFAGSAAILPEMRHFFEGLHEVDSFNFNPHKWLLTNFDCCTMWVADQVPLKKALSLTPIYLQAKGNVLDLKDWQIPLGRRFRALKLFFVLRTYGAAKLREYLRFHIKLADRFVAHLQTDSRFTLTTPPKFSLVCFHLAGQSNEVNAKLLAAINATGNTFMVNTKLGDQFTLRMAIGGTLTKARHVDEVWQIIKAAADEVLGSAADVAVNSATIQ